jgi:23S rRNA pseudouridine2457 synthase
LNKPYGYVSQFISNQPLAHKKNYLGELYDFPPGTMAIGRLDEPSEGLLLLTTDGKVSEKIRSGSIEKEYWVQLDGVITDEGLEEMRAGIEINVEGRKHLSIPTIIESIVSPRNLQQRSKAIRDERHGPTSWISITLREGKFRQIRKMTAKAGFPTLRLIRVRIGKLRLGDMEAGECREISSSTLRI